MSPLDSRLYEWLAEPDDARFERAFQAYYLLALPALIRRLASLSRWDVAVLEELAQDALLRFFEKIGRERRLSAARIQQAVARIRPALPGELHQRQLSVWTGDVGRFKDSSMSFRPGIEPTDSGALRAAIAELAAHIPPLQLRGCRFLQQARCDSGLRTTAAGGAVMLPEDPESAVDTTGEWVRELGLESMGTSIDAAGMAAFVANAWLVVHRLPALRVPSNGLLFEIATNIFFDEYKRRSRKKRGGEEVTAESGETAASQPSVDTVDQYESQEFLEKFHDFLRAPLDQAIAAHERAAACGNARAEQHRMESLARRFSTLTSVLALLAEGYTQEQSADRLGLTRNQVKYVVETVQDAYARFIRDPRVPVADSRSREGASHVL